MNEKGLKQGDRVQVTLVGSVRQIDRFDNVLISSAGFVYPAWVLPDVVEKLEDPEPTWIFGDVVKAQGYYPFLRTYDRWLGPGSAEIDFEKIIRQAWKADELEILNKADA